MTYLPKEFNLTPAIDAQFFPMPEDSSSSDGVAAPCAAYQDMRRYWDVIDAVKGGTIGLQDAAQAYLPLEPFEKEAAYNRRLQRCSFSQWYERLTRGLIGMVMRKPITFEISEQVEEQLQDIDLQGNDIDSFVREVFKDAIDRGHSGILVDYPRAEGINTLAEQKASGVRPYWVHIKTENIIGWRYQTVRSRPLLVQLRLKESAIEPSGEFGEKTVSRVKVYDLVNADGIRCRYRIFQKDESNDKYVLVDNGLMSLPYIPYFPVYTERTGLLTSKPPMLEVAHLNLKHYQLQSDLDNALHVAAYPKLVLYGYDPIQGDVSMAADEAICFPDSNCKAEWIAPPATSFDAIANRIKEVELQMSVLGLSALVSQKNVGESAEAKKLDRAQGDSMLSVCAQALQDCIDNCLQAHADYLEETAGTCQVNRDFDLVQLTAQDIDSFSRLQQMGQLSLETFLEILKKGEVLPDEFDIEAELEKIARGDRGNEVLSNGTEFGTETKTENSNGAGVGATN